MKQFEAKLNKEPGRFCALDGAAHAGELCGSREVSQKYFRELLKVCSHTDKPGRPEVVAAQRAISTATSVRGNASNLLERPPRLSC
jgi:hypothetical protein